MFLFQNWRFLSQSIVFPAGTGIGTPPPSKKTICFIRGTGITTRSGIDLNLELERNWILELDPPHPKKNSKALKWRLELGLEVDLELDLLPRPHRNKNIFTATEMKIEIGSGLDLPPPKIYASPA